MGHEVFNPQQFKYRPLDFMDWAGIPLYDWQRRIIAEFLVFTPEGEPVYSVVAVSVPRSNGKTWLSAAVGAFRFICWPGDTLSAAISRDSSKKTQRYARLFLTSKPELARLVQIRTNEIRLKGTDYTWDIASRDALMTRSAHYRTVLYDEVGWVGDSDMFETLSAGQGSEAQPLMLLTSTVGRRTGPLVDIQRLAARKTPGVYSFHSTKNESPLITPEYLERQRRLLNPLIFDREHCNLLREGSDLFCTKADLDAAFGSGWAVQSRGTPDCPYFCYVDLASTGLASAAILHLDTDGSALVDEIHLWHGGRQRVRIESVEHYLLDAFQRYNLRRIRIESFQGLALEQALENKGLPVEFHQPTAQSMSLLWNTLQSLLTNHKLRLYRIGPGAKELAQELEGMVTEVTAQGVKVRGSPHPDVAVSVGGACVLAVEGSKKRGGLCFGKIDWGVDFFKTRAALRDGY
jgi:hypothetical protein